MKDGASPRRPVGRRPQVAPPESPALPLMTSPLPSPEASKVKGSWRALVVVGFIIVALGIATILTKDFIPQPKADENVMNQSQQPPAEPEPPFDVSALEQKIDEIIAKYPTMQIGVAFSDLKSSTEVHAGIQEPYVAASTTKLLTAALYLKQVEEGKHSLDEIVDGTSALSRLRTMIEDSDNASKQAFNTLLGAQSLNDYAESLAMHDYSALDNLCTTRDIATFLEKLYERDLLNEEHTTLLLSFMSNASEHQYIPAGVPDGYTVYHKAGYLQDRAHDAAIIDDGKQPFTIVIFSKTTDAYAPYDYKSGAAMMHEIVQVVLDAYAGSRPTD